MTAVVCAQCNGVARDLGPLPGANVFAGRALENIFPGGRLYRCERCHFGFRQPRLSKAELDSLYAAGAVTHWNYTEQRREDWAHAAKWIVSNLCSSGSVVDLGCFDGSFLSLLPGCVHKVGIEIMPEAAGIAQSRGIQIMGNNFECLAEGRERFDAVTAFDVIEHVPDPVAFLDSALAALKPGGCLLVSTGNLDAWTWRVMRSRYWYCAIPEHISFLSERWFRETATRRLCVDVMDVYRYAHVPSFRRHIREAASNLTFLMAPQLIGMLRRRNARKSGESGMHPALMSTFPPIWHSAPDHILVVMRKRAQE